MRKTVLFTFIFSLLFFFSFTSHAYAAACEVTVTPNSGMVAETEFIISAKGAFTNNLNSKSSPAPLEVSISIVKQPTTIPNSGGLKAPLKGDDANKSFDGIKFGPVNSAGTYNVIVFSPNGSAGNGRGGSVTYCLTSITVNPRPTPSEPTPAVGEPTWTPTPDPTGCNPAGIDPADKTKCLDPRCKVVAGAGRTGTVCKLYNIAVTPTPQGATPTPRTPAPPCKIYAVAEIHVSDRGHVTPIPLPSIVVDPKKPLIFEDNKQYNCVEVDTALGGISTDPVQFVKKLFAIILSLSGGLAVLLIIYAGYQLMLSQGNPEKINGAKETLTSAIIGLVFIIFSLVILQIIGVDILRLPGFSR